MEQLTKERISEMGESELADNVVSIFDLPDPIKREQVSLLMSARAKELGISRAFERLLRAANNAENKLSSEYTQANRQPDSGVSLQYDSKNRPAETIDNYLAILRNDEHFSTVRFNQFTISPEITERLKTRNWQDVDDSSSMQYIESAYGLYNQPKYEHSIRMLCKERAYHPVRDYIDALKWDGTPRIESFLTEWMGCEDSDYSKEVSRLIFAGGIHRIYGPGCKFDSVPVLIGTKQGEGKSTLVRWLAIKDDWYGELTTIEGKEGIEAIQGTWICEISELLAMVRSKEVEAAKAYITRQVDKYRVPWDKRPSTAPRQCIFIGTTNKERFLTDKTGNRRWFPIHVNSDGYELYKREKECRAYIVQCWAEAKAKYSDEFTKLAPNYKLLDTIRQKQQAAEEDDWREGMIEDYLSKKRPGDTVCAMELYQEALKMGEYNKPSPAEQSAINLIMQKFPLWERTDKPVRFHKYGVSRGWTYTPGMLTDDEVPF
jgi:predicted P-loop ATPase